MSFKWLLAFSYVLASVLETDAMTPSKGKPYTCRTFGSGVVQPFNGTLYHVQSNCAFTLTRFTHNRVECDISVKRGHNGLLVYVEIMINKIKTVLQNGTIQVETTSVRLPYDHTYQHIFPYGIYTKLRSAVLPLSVIWHTVPVGIDTLWIETEIELSSDMTGLCGNDLRLTNSNAFRLTYESVLPGEPCVMLDPVSSMNTDCRMFFSYTLDCLMHATPELIRLCEENIYSFEQNQFVSCSFFKEVVRQCGNSSYMWDLWRKITHCEEPKCAGDLFYVEEGTAFVPTCSNQKTDSYDVTSSCVCPNGLVLDDHQVGSRCVSVSSCPCVFGNNLYQPGDTRSTKRETCLCTGGHWKCTPQDLPPVCVIEGQFVTTFDGKQYIVRSGCSFVAAQGPSWEIIVNLESASIKSMHLHLFEDKYSFADNLVLFGNMEISDVHKSEHALVYWQSSMFVQVNTTFGLKLQVQMFPEIQLYISPPLHYSCTISGLCGNNNGDTTDDFRTSSGIIESSAQVFAMSWSVDKCNRIQPPSTCIRSEYEIFAEEKCSVLTNPTGIFAACHGHVPTDDYLNACIQKTCTCASHLHQCLCLALSSYVKVCTSLGVEVGDWRKATGCSVKCPNNWEFSYNVVACNSTCRSLSGQDLSCLQAEAPVEGCSCPKGTHINMGHTCSPKSQCECHYSGGTTPPGPAVIDGRQCICEDGQLRCSEDCGCTNGKVCVHCSENNVNTLPKTCGRLSKTFGSLCESGCYCPFDQYENHYGVCVPLENCTCSYSGNVYASGDSIKGNCKTCVCSHGQWLCTEESCPGKCQLYGNGHYQTFDSKWFRFDGHCQYTLVEDDCGYGNGTFSVRVESVPCCDEALTCSRSISLDVKGLFFLILSNMTVAEHVHSRLSLHSEPLYTVHTVGLYIVVSVPSKGITLIWDKHTWITVELQPQWRNGVCGLCGNYDSSEMNDLQIKDSSVALSPMTFGNSWKSPSPPCSDVTQEIFPCERHSYCASWAQRRCRIITGDIFKNCHLKVDPEPYYQACVQESCSCEFEGRFLGFCTAVAAYAEACSDWDICVDWRTPDLCPVYCDYYNEHNQCVWHYEACGKLLTCGQEKYYNHKLEGCYPRCPEERPYYDENIGTCTDLRDCTCSFQGTFIMPRAYVIIGSEECYCQNGIIKCPPVPTTSTPIPTIITNVTSTTASTTSTWTTMASTTTESPPTTTTASPATTTTTPTSSTLITTSTPPTTVTSTTTSTTTLAPTTYSSPNTTATRGSPTTTITSTTTTTPPGTTTAPATTVTVNPNATTTTTVQTTSVPVTTSTTATSTPISTSSSSISTTPTAASTITTKSTSTTTLPSTSTPTSMSSTTTTPTPATTTTTTTSSTFTTIPTPPTAVTSTTTSTTTIAPTSTATPTASTTRGSLTTTITSSTTTSPPTTTTALPTTFTANPTTNTTTTVTPTISTTTSTQTTRASTTTESPPTTTTAQTSSTFTTTLTPPTAVTSTATSSTTIAPTTNSSPNTSDTITTTTPMPSTTATRGSPTTITSTTTTAPPGTTTAPPTTFTVKPTATTTTTTVTPTTSTTTSTTRTQTTRTSTTTESSSTTITPTATTTTTPTSSTLITTSTPPTTVTSTTTTSTTTIVPTTYSSPNTSDTLTTPMPSTTSWSTTPATPTTTTTLTTTTATPTASTTATMTTSPPGTTTAPPTTFTVNPTATTTSTVAPTISTTASTTSTQTTRASTTTESPPTTTTAPTSSTLTTTPTPPTTVTSTTTSSTTIAPTTPMPTTTSNGTTTILTSTTATPTANTTSTRGSPTTTITSTTTTAPPTTVTVNPTATTTTVPTTTATTSTTATSTPYSTSSSISTTLPAASTINTKSTSMNTLPSTSTPTSMSSTIITPTTTSTTATTAETTLSTIPTTVEDCECVNLRSKQKWQCGETWTEDCNHVTCTNNMLQLTPVQCPEYEYPHCPRGLVVNVSDGCCERPTCDCRCELYGDPHYISFQGVLFDFFDNCTYILVEEQWPLYNLTIAVDNIFCIPGLDGSCVNGVIVKYKGNTAVLNIVQDTVTVQVFLNNMLIQTPFEQFGMRFESTGYITTLFLPEIRSYVSLTPSFTLVVNLAMENFLDNTQGQCGVCGGGSCIRRGGQVEDDSCCEKTAHDWVYEDSQKPECSSAAKDLPCSITPPPTSPPCQSPLCDLLQHRVFAECRKRIDLTPIFKSCEFDSCRRSPPCSALVQAAEECKKCGVLIEWRTLTNGSCDIPCPDGLVFKEYSPKMDDFCLGGVRHKGTPAIDYVAGCFCPNGQIRESSHSDTCVHTCKFCKGPLGEPKVAGEEWRSNCHICSCNNQTLTEECSEFIPPPPPLCGPNQVLSNRCCGQQECVEKTCRYKGNVYKVGETWRDIAEPCKSFICSVEGVQTDTEVCPTQDCPKEQRIWDERHCCFTCASDSCAPVMANLNVTVGQCSSELQMPVCDGLCHSHHRVVVAGALQAQQSYSCCKESSSEYRPVALKCSDQTNMTHIYKHITRCQCVPCE